ncbi:hypothetical protein BGZ97_000873 [Linnemannia gamsii]|uniref:Uncharacterized protein n=1 Tax=Linnemannia gamsii TaxID=64522 RepID=A0A9P6QXF2_9FUNG|nr:hypothetical protein BGZ97_000873 [Linnemannia gamsii]
MRIPRPLSRFILAPQQSAPRTVAFNNGIRDNTRFLTSTWTRSPLTWSNSRRVSALQQTPGQSDRVAGLSTSAQDLTGSNMRCIQGHQHSRRLFVPLQEHCPGILARSTTTMMTIPTRTLMTQTNRQQDSIIKYSGENDDFVTPQEYRIRVGTAIRTLREELPQFFQQGLCTTSIYAPNIRLIEASHTNVSLQGKPIYFLLAGAVRWSFKMWFRDIKFEIQSIRVNDRGGRGISGLDSGNDNDNMSTSTTCRITGMEQSELLRSHEPKQEGDVIMERKKQCESVQSTGVDGINIDQRGNGNGGEPSLPATTVRVRWTLKGTTRPSVVLTTSGPTSPPPSSYEGIFVYEIDDRGLIDEHRIENIMPSPSPEAIQRAFAWWGWLLSRTRPAATATFEDAAASRKRLGLD